MAILKILKTIKGTVGLKKDDTDALRLKLNEIIDVVNDYSDGSQSFAEHITDTTASTSTATGALIVDGGTGIAGALYVGGAIVQTATTDSSSSVTGALKTAGGLGDKIKVKPLVSSQTIGNFISAFIGGMTIINEKEFTSKVIDAIFGTVSANQKKTLTDIKKEEMFNKTLDKISNDEENLDLTQEDLYEIDVISQNKLTGNAKVDVGCSIIDSNVSLDDLQNLISGNTGTTDPVAIGRNFGNLINNSFGKNPDQTNPTNKNAIRDGFFKRLIDTIKSIIVDSVTAAPQIRILIAIVAGLKNNDDISSALGSPIEDIKKQKNLIKCLIDSAVQTLTEFIFNLVKTELIKLIVPVATVILREKIKNFINILKSLV